MYLEEDRDADETAAFEARYASPARRMKALAWHGPETMTATAFAAKQLAAERAARAEESGHPVDRDDPASYRDGAQEMPSEPWTVGGVPAGGGCLVGVLAFLAIRVNGVVALFDRPRSPRSRWGALPGFGKASRTAARGTPGDACDDPATPAVITASQPC